MDSFVRFDSSNWIRRHFGFEQSNNFRIILSEVRILASTKSKFLMYDYKRSWILLRALAEKSLFLVVFPLGSKDANDLTYLFMMRLKEANLWCSRSMIKS